MKLAIITTHPIQYNAPWFAMLAQRGKVEVKVFYTWSQTVLGNKYDPGFGKNIEWDIPLLEEYEYTFVKNTSSQPGSHHYKGIVNPTLVKEIEEWKANAVLVFGWNFNSHLHAIRYFNKKIRVLFRGDSTLLDEQKGVKNLLKTIYLKWVYRHINIALYTGTQNKLYYQKYGLKDEKLVFAPHAVDNKRFYHVKAETIKDWRATLGISPADIVILFAGKLEPKKNPGLLIKAFSNMKPAHLPDENSSVHLIIVGNGLLEAELKKSYQNNRIHFVNFQNQSVMPTIYHACNIFVLPSAGPGETWGLAVNEAMASGKPVIVSDKCGCAVDLVRNGINGAVFKSGDVKNITYTLSHFINGEADLEQMGAESLNIIRNWNYEIICEQIENLLLIKF